MCVCVCMHMFMCVCVCESVYECVCASSKRGHKTFLFPVQWRHEMETSTHPRRHTNNLKKKRDGVVRVWRELYPSAYCVVVLVPVAVPFTPWLRRCVCLSLSLCVCLEWRWWWLVRGCAVAVSSLLYPSHRVCVCVSVSVYVSLSVSFCVCVCVCVCVLLLSLCSWEGCGGGGSWGLCGGPRGRHLSPVVVVTVAPCGVSWGGVNCLFLCR